jgi:AraC-like DNA-binding protein
MLPISSSTHESPLGHWNVVRRRSLSSFRDFSAGYIALQGRIEQKQEVQLPTGDPSIVVNFGAPFVISEHGNARSVGMHASLSVMGPHNRPFVAENPYSRELLVLHLTPVGAHVILGANMRELINRWLPLEDVVGPDATRLAEQLRESRSWCERFEQLDFFLGRRIGAKKMPRRDMRRAVNRMRVSRTSVRSLASEMGISNKHLIQQFQNQVGFTPKTVARIARFNRALRLTDGARNVDWAATAQRCGYFDQAHLIKDFRELALATPRAIKALRNELILSTI